MNLMRAAISVNNVFPLDKVYLFLFSWVMVMVRMSGFFWLIPIFNKQMIPGLLRFAVVGSLSVILVPMVSPDVSASRIGGFAVIFFLFKEAFIGLAMSFFVAVPFWSFEAAGFLVDNQRGATLASIFNPLTDDESSPIGILLGQFFIVLFLISGGLNLILTMVYDSFVIWDMISWAPALRQESIPKILGQLDRLVRIGVLFASPVLIAMFLAELGLGLISRFAPQLQVFFIAMPVKSALAMFVFAIYAGSLLHYGMLEVSGLKQLLPMFNEHWRRNPAGAL